MDQPSIDSTRAPSAGRWLALGVVLGIVLGSSRAIDGMHASLLNSSSAFDRAGLRALPLLALGLTFGLRSVALAPIALITGCLAGLLLQALALAPCWIVESRLEAVGLCAALAAVLLLATRNHPRRRYTGRHALQWLGWCLAGSGLGACLEILARGLRGFGLGRPEDDATVAIALCATILLGALAFGRGGRAGHSRAVLACGLTLAASLTLLGMQRMSQLITPGALQGFLSSLVTHPKLNLDWSQKLPLSPSYLGSFAAGAPLAAAIWIAPGLALGASLGRQQRTGQLGACLCGLALGPWLLNFAIQSSSRVLELDQLSSYAGQNQWFPLFIAFACGGSLLALFSAREQSLEGGRKLAAALCLLSLSLPLFLRPQSNWCFSPWLTGTGRIPNWVAETPNGLLSVEGWDADKVAWIDARRLTPTHNEAAAERERLKAALTLIASSDSARILLCGPLSSPLLEVLSDRPDWSVDRCADWFEFGPKLEQSLHGEMTMPAGEWLSPPEAGAALRSGAYAMVLAPSNFGPHILGPPGVQWIAAPTAPATRAWLDSATPIVAWLPSSSRIAARELGTEVLLQVRPLEAPSAAILSRGALAAARQTKLELMPCQAPRRRAEWGLWIDRNAPISAHAERAQFAARLSDSNPQSPLATFLGEHFAAQTISSPWESRAERVEFDPAHLAPLTEALLQREPSPLERDLLEELAPILVGQRRPDVILEQLQPIAEVWAPWTALDWAVLEAQIEFDLDAEVRAGFERLQARLPESIEIALRAAEWALDKQRPDEASAHLDRAREIAPKSVDFTVLEERLQALREAADGDPALGPEPQAQSGPKPLRD